MLLEGGTSSQGNEKLIRALTLFASLSIQDEVDKTQELLGL
jgi:hypothetical protein